MAQEFSRHIYASQKWQRLRLRLIAGSNGICTMCNGSFASEYLRVHHKTELNEFNITDANMVYGEDNLQVVCSGCHNKLHDRARDKGTPRERPERKVYIVTGAPMSGKTTYVNDTATPFDLVIDLDKIFYALSINPLYEKPNELTSAVFLVRDALYDMIRTRGGRHHNSYIVSGRNLSELERLAKQLNAEITIVKSTREECLSRLKSDRSGRNKLKWAEYIARWFDENETHELNTPPACE